jgi:membrane-bound lytic murein transglycosylase B
MSLSFIFSSGRWRNVVAALTISILWTGHSAATPQDEQTEPTSSWEIRKSAIINLSRNHPAARFLPGLVKGLAAKAGAGASVSEAEFLALFDRADSRQVYADYLIKVATPRSVKIQNKEHADYSKVFLAEKRIKRGVDFLKEHETLLKKAEQQYGVAPQDIVSILMWESGLGEFTGKLRVFNVFMAQLLFLEEAQHEAVRRMIDKGESNPLASFEIIEHQKQRFEKIRRRCVSNMIALLRQCKATGVDPLNQRGSWAGAIGYPQFMPASMPHADDGDGDGDIDLHTWPDAIMSVGKYLKERGKYGPTEKARRKAIFSYNPLDSYVDGVVKYADAIRVQSGKSGNS